MLVREAYRSVTHSVCRPHYTGKRPLPDGAPVLGPVVDARHVRECEFCQPALESEYHEARRDQSDYDLVIAYDSCRTTPPNQRAWDHAERLAAIRAELKRRGYSHSEQIEELAREGHRQEHGYKPGARPGGRVR